MGLAPGSYFGVPHSGYLGWGLGTALGLKLAQPDSTVVATIGDGSYIFAVPSRVPYAIGITKSANIGDHIQQPGLRSGQAGYPRNTSRWLGIQNEHFPLEPT